MCVGGVAQLLKDEVESADQDVIFKIGLCGDNSVVVARKSSYKVLQQVRAAREAPRPWPRASSALRARTEDRSPPVDCFANLWRDVREASKPRRGKPHGGGASQPTL